MEIGDKVLIKIRGNTKAGKEIQLEENQIAELPGSIDTFIPNVDLVQIRLNYPIHGKLFALVPKEDIIIMSIEKISITNNECSS